MSQKRSLRRIANDLIKRLGMMGTSRRDEILTAFGLKKIGQKERAQFKKINLGTPKEDVLWSIFKNPESLEVKQQASQKISFLLYNRLLSCAAEKMEFSRQFEAYSEIRKGLLLVAGKRILEDLEKEMLALLSSELQNVKTTERCHELFFLAYKIHLKGIEEKAVSKAFEYAESFTDYRLILEMVDFNSPKAATCFLSMARIPIDETFQKRKITKTVK